MSATNLPVALWDQEACQAFLGIGRSVPYQLMRQKNDPLPFLRVSSRRRFDPIPVQAWARRQSEGTTERKPLARMETPDADRFIAGNPARGPRTAACEKRAS